MAPDASASCGSSPAGLTDEDRELVMSANAPTVFDLSRAGTRSTRQDEVRG
jgi:hypothetical protein